MPPPPPKKHQAGILLWSLFTFLTPAAAAKGLGPAIAARVLLGAGEGVAFPAVHSMIKEFVPPRYSSYRNTNKHEDQSDLLHPDQTPCITLSHPQPPLLGRRRRHGRIVRGCRRRLRPHALDHPALRLAAGERRAPLERRSMHPFPRAIPFRTGVLFLRRRAPGLVPSLVGAYGLLAHDRRPQRGGRDSSRG